MASNKRYIFTLMKKGGGPAALYIGDKELPEEVINHEFSTRQMRDILQQYEYTQIRWS